MNTFKLSKLATAISVGFAAVALGDDGHRGHGSIRPDSHAPIGVMGDHMHKKGEWMLSYRYMTMKMEGHRRGEDSISAAEVFHRGFDVAVMEMDMDMHMLGLMHAPNDRITLMAMTNYIEKEMIMMSNPNGGGGHGHGGGMGTGHAGVFGHSSRGWGDLQVSSLIRVGNTDTSPWHLNVGISVPTGSVSEKQGDVFLPYGMQLGSGTWDAKIGATYAKSKGSRSWGAQALGTIRLQDEGNSGFARSDRFEATTWYGFRASESISISGRLKYSGEGSLEGHYNGPHMHRAPNHFTANYGGDIVEGIIGANFVFQSGALEGHRIAFEYGMPLYQQLNGIGMNREEMITLGWQKAW